MLLLDHFHPPLAPRRHWESFHVNWAGAIADALNESLLPEGYFAEEHARLGPRVEIDVATFDDPGPSGHREGGTTTLPPLASAPPAAAMVVPAAFPDAIEILVFESEGGARPVAAIELVSPGNKDRDAQRQAFAVECASYLCRGISLIIIDIVSIRRANLHNEIMRVLGHGDAFAMSAEAALYGVAYRPIVRDGLEQIEAWPSPLEIGRPLPVLPLALNAKIVLPIDLEDLHHGLPTPTADVTRKPDPSTSHGLLVWANALRTRIMTQDDSRSLSTGWTMSSGLLIQNATNDTLRSATPNDWLAFGSGAEPGAASSTTQAAQGQAGRNADDP